MGLLYVEIKIELSGPVWPGVLCDEIQIGQQHDQSIGLLYVETKIELSRAI